VIDAFIIVEQPPHVFPFLNHILLAGLVNVLMKLCEYHQVNINYENQGVQGKYKTNDVMPWNVPESTDVFWFDWPDCMQALTEANAQPQCMYWY
jgi:hypothetical protein